MFTPMTSISRSQPSVSVVIPAFNAERFIKLTLLSACQQTLRNIEIIVVDDGSTDATRHIAEAARDEDPRIVLLSKTRNEGVAAARNDGVSASTAKYVAFLDADDLWHPTKLEKQLASISQSNFEHTGASYTLYRLIDPQGNVIGNGPYWNIQGSVLARHIVFHPVGNGSSLLVLKTAVSDVGGYDSTFARRGAGGCEDLDFELKLAKRYSVSVVSEYLVGYRIHDEAMSKNRERMARAMDLTIRSHLTTTKNLSLRCTKWAMGNSLVYQLFCHASRKNLRRFVETCFVLLKTAPVFGIEEVLARLLTKALRSQALNRVSFFEVDPALIVRTSHRLSKEMRLAALEREDRSCMSLED